MEVAKLTDVTRIYKIGQVETRALNGVSITIGDGEFTSLVGPSGSGKTTLLQLIGCLDKPTSGKVIIDGKETTNLNRNQRADLRKGTIGFVFQFFALIPTLTAYENVEMPLLLNGKNASQRKQRTMELLEGVDVVGLSSILVRVYGEKRQTNFYNLTIAASGRLGEAVEQSARLNEPAAFGPEPPAPPPKSDLLS